MYSAGQDSSPRSFASPMTRVSRRRPSLRARELVLGVSLWNLLCRRLVITSLTFDEPEFQIITDETRPV